MLAHAPVLAPPGCVPRRVLFFLAQHHDRLGSTAEALRFVDQCIEVRARCLRCARLAGLRARCERCLQPSGASLTATAAASLDGRLLVLLQHTPTLIEAYVAKAKILKHAGALALGGSLL